MDSCELNWLDTVWKDINGGVVTEVNKVRVAQKVFSTTAFDNHPPNVTNEIINFTDLSIKEGKESSGNNTCKRGEDMIDCKACQKKKKSSSATSG